MKFRLQESHFTTDTLPSYSDPEGDRPYILKIVQIPLEGTLTFNDNLVTEGQEFTFPDAVRNGRLEYQSDDNLVEEYTDRIRYKLADVGSNLFSNVGTIKIKVPKKCTAPWVNDNSAFLESKKYEFKLTDFIKDFVDEDGDSYSNVTIISTPSIPQLRFKGRTVQEGTSFLVEESDELIYQLPDRYAVYDGEIYEFEKNITTVILDAENAGYRFVNNEQGTLYFEKVGSPFITLEIEGTPVNNDSLCFEFTTSDDSEENLPSNKATFCLIPQGDINVVEAYVNEPPVIGDFNIELEHGEEHHFQITNFTTDTTPPYWDKEGDEASILKIEELPVQGQLFLGDNEVNKNQEISILNTNNLIYKSNEYNSDEYTDLIQFRIKDTQSPEFSNIGTISILVNEEEAVAPTVSNVNIDFNEDKYTFKVEDFTYNFYDENGDSYKKTKILTLPELGKLTFNNQELTQGIEFELSEVNNLQYRIPDNYRLTSGGYYGYPEPIEDIKNNYISQGYELVSEQPSRIVFKRTFMEGVPYDTDVYAFFDTTSMDVEDGQAAHDALISFIEDFRVQQPEYTGNMYTIPINKENWLSFPEIIHRGSSTAVRNNPNRPDDDFMAFAEIPDNFDITSNNPNPNWTPPQNLMILAFIDEVAAGTTEYHFENQYPIGFTDQPTTQYFKDYDKFVDLYNNEFNFFRGVFYPIPNITSINYNNQFNAAVLQGFAAIEGGATYTKQQMEDMGVIRVEERHFDKVLDVNHPEYVGTDPEVANPYSYSAQTPVPNSDKTLQGLRSYGWIGVYDKRTPASEVFSSITFENEISEYLIGNETEVQEQIVIEGEFHLAEPVCFNFQTSDDSQYELYSNEATICLNTDLENNSPTVADNTAELANTKTLTFNEDSFTNEFNDVDDDNPGMVTITTIPNLNGLYYVNTPITENFTFDYNTSVNLEFRLNDRYAVYDGILYDFNRSLDSIISDYEDDGFDLTDNTEGTLTFSERGNYSNKRQVRGNRINSNTTCFKFKISDDSPIPEDSNEAEFCINISGNINIKETNENNPPIVGDGEIVVQFGTYYKFKESDFIDTNPPYYDPEGDPPYKLILKTLPEHGVLRLFGSAITQPQEINFNAIRNGAFGYDYDGVESSTFEFEISDEGSKIPSG